MTRYLITGGAGFLGGHLLWALAQARSADSDSRHVADIVQDPYRNPNLALMKDAFHYHWQHCKDLPPGLYNADVVIHLAAQADVPFAISSPVNTWDVNTGSLLAVLERIRLMGGPTRPHLFLISSESALGDLGADPTQPFPANENAHYYPVGMYGASKAAEELLAYGYARGYKLNITILRSATMFGPYMRMNQAIPYFLSQALKSQPIKLQSPDSTRDFNYVTNVTDAIVAAVDKRRKLDKGEYALYHIGSGIERKILDVARACWAVANPTATANIEAPTDAERRPGEEKGVRLALDITRAKNELGYEPEVSFESGLELTTQWLRATH